MSDMHGFVEPSPTKDLDTKLDEAFGPESDLASVIKKNMQETQEQAPDPDRHPLAMLPNVSIQRGGLTFPQFSRTPGEIYARMNAVMTEVSHVGKSGFNQQQGYNFRGIDAVINALGPAMRKFGILPVPTLKKVKYRDTLTTGQKPTREVTVLVNYRFVAPDGSYVEALVPGESLDQSDKGTAKAMSVAYRIALLQVFALPTDEPDPDASYHTRDGAGAMTPELAEMLYDLVGRMEASQIERLWKIVMAHAAAERTALASEGPETWAELFFEQIQQLIEQVETWDGGKTLMQALTAAGLLGLHAKGGTDTVEALLRARADFLKKRTLETFDHSMQQITTAETPDELATAMGCVEASVEVGVLTKQHADQLWAVAEERRPKVAAAMNVAAGPLPEEA